MRRLRIGGARRGQSRLIEAILAALIIFVVFSVAVYLVTSAKLWTVHERGDLDRAGYNLLHTLAESRVIEQTVDDPSVNSTAPLYMVVQRFLPPMTYFNLTVYKLQVDDDGVTINRTIVDKPISNADSADSFTRSSDVSSTTFIYTSRRGNIYYIVLMLARGGEGA
ncbi:MAG: hypothetical protein QW057_07290 [Candidatus Bathyarchaeia archaeon]